MKSNKQLFVCPVCGSHSMLFPSILKNRKACNAKCWGMLRRKTKEARSCLICTKKFTPKHPKSPGLYCSYKCMGIANRKESIMRNGYRYLLLPEHPNATRQGYFAEHRYVVEKAIGRLLDKKELVHHINHITTDNRIENLKVFPTAGAHMVSCHLPRRKNGKWAKRE